ncbi:hypothetical protein NC651_013721 [Populus alba x Populus x berolinensis]|nr:hypothetical protein NC651_013721 [Populus alba x Populus x berolinensis]
MLSTHPCREMVLHQEDRNTSLSCSEQYIVIAVEMLKTNNCTLTLLQIRNLAPHPLFSCVVATTPQARTKCPRNTLHL